MPAKLDTKTKKPVTRKADHGIEVYGLLLTEGQIKYGGGQQGEHTPESLAQIVAATQEMQASGKNPRILINHNGGILKVGDIVAPPEVAQITKENLPRPELADFLGLWGLFAWLNIKDATIIDRLEAGLIQDLSVGIHPNLEIMQGAKAGTALKNVLFEVSIVNNGANWAASIVTASAVQPEEELLRAEGGAISVTKTAAMTIRETLKDEKSEIEIRNFLQLTEALADTARSILRDDPDNFRSRIIPQAEDYVALMRETFAAGGGGGNQQPIPPVPIIGGTMSVKTVPVQPDTPEIQTAGKTAQLQQAVQSLTSQLEGLYASLQEKETVIASMQTRLDESAKLQEATALAAEYKLERANLCELAYKKQGITEALVAELFPYGDDQNAARQAHLKGECDLNVTLSIAKRHIKLAKAHFPEIQHGEMYQPGIEPKETEEAIHPAADAVIANLRREGKLTAEVTN